MDVGCVCVSTATAADSSCSSSISVVDCEFFMTDVSAWMAATATAVEGSAAKAVVNTATAGWVSSPGNASGAGAAAACCCCDSIERQAGRGLTSQEHRSPRLQEAVSRGSR